MIVALARKLFGSSNEPRIKRYMPRWRRSTRWRKELEKLSDDALRARTEVFKKPVAVADSNPASSARA
jgi:preprotein translocase subunit SecA